MDMNKHKICSRCETNEYLPEEADYCYACELQLTYGDEREQAD